MVTGLSGVQLINFFFFWSATRSSDLFNHEYDYRPNWTTKFCYQLITTLTKFVIYEALFLIKRQEILRFFLLAVKKSHLSARVMARSVQLLRHDAYCPIKLSN